MYHFLLGIGIMAMAALMESMLPSFPGTRSYCHITDRVQVLETMENSVYHQNFHLPIFVVVVIVVLCVQPFFLFLPPINNIDFLLKLEFQNRLSISDIVEY